MTSMCADLKLHRMQCVLLLPMLCVPITPNPLFAPFFSPLHSSFYLKYRLIGRNRLLPYFLVGTVYLNQTNIKEKLENKGC